MALLLSIDTATSVCSIALHNDGKLIADQSLHLDQSHSTLLVPSIDTLLNYCQYSLNDLNGIVISMGPGSYTGLRIGTSTAKGLCYSLDIPLVSVNTLEAMALQVIAATPQGEYFCPMIDARRMEVYTTMVDYNMNIIFPTRPEIVDETSFSDILKEKRVAFFGNGAEKCKKVINGENAYFIDNVAANASSVGVLGYEKYKKGEVENAAYFEPFYLKEFRATKPKKLQ